MGTPIRAKKHRLPEAAYVGKKVVHITANVEHRRRIFTDPEVVRVFVEMLRACAAKERCMVLIYCFMPDHLHLLIEGTAANSRPKAAIDAFKDCSGHWLLHNRPGWNWQEGYYDTIMRRSDDLKQKAFYIFQNPMRAGIVVDPYTYPYTGSIGYDLVEMLHEIAW